MTSQKRIETSTISPRSEKPVAEDVIGDLVVEVGAEGLPDPLALAQARDHLVEGGGELADLVGRRHRDGDVEVALGDGVGRALQVGERAAGSTSTAGW